MKILCDLFYKKTPKLPHETEVVTIQKKQKVLSEYWNRLIALNRRLDSVDEMYVLISVAQHLEKNIPVTDLELDLALSIIKEDSLPDLAIKIAHKEILTTPCVALFKAYQQSKNIELTLGSVNNTQRVARAKL